MRALVTGADGFVGKHLIAALLARGYDVVAAGGPSANDGSLRIDVTKFETLQHALEEARPEVIFHLAGQAFVPQAIANPLEAFAINAMGTVRLLDAVRTYGKSSGSLPRFLLAGSASVYGRVADSKNPLREDYPIGPIEPYGASKAAAECACIAFKFSYGMPALIPRSFNHIGPGQDVRFVIPYFANQLARIKTGLDKPVLLVGNLTTERDFLDVRDVVEAYIRLAEQGEIGEIYNVCSGVPMRIADILQLLIQIAGVPVEVREDPARMREVDQRVFYGDNTKICALGWAPRIPLGRSLREIFEHALAAQLETARK